MLIPVVLAVVGYLINNTLQQQQRALDKLKLTEQIVSEAFDSNNPDKAMALSILIFSVSDDKKFAQDLNDLINNFYYKKALNALKAGDEIQYQQISEAAEVFQGSKITITDSLKLNPTASKAEKARAYEQEGIRSIQMGDLSAAKENFQKAEKAYPGFHSSYEISNLIKDKLDDVNEGKLDSAQATDQVLKEVQNQYSWKLDKKFLVKSSPIKKEKDTF